MGVQGGGAFVHQPVKIRQRVGLAFRRRDGAAKQPVEVLTAQSVDAEQDDVMDLRRRRRRCRQTSQTQAAQAGEAQTGEQQRGDDFRSRHDVTLLTVKSTVCPHRTAVGIRKSL
jgi:hypothetical protein